MITRDLLILAMRSTAVSSSSKAPPMGLHEPENPETPESCAGRSYLSGARDERADASRVIEVGCGSGVIMRELARRTAGANRLIGRDMSPYLLREARALARRTGCSTISIFGEGRASSSCVAAIHTSFFVRSSPIISPKR